MKYLQKSVRTIIAASVLSLSLLRAVAAQQEVSPDHFDSVSVQDQQAAKASLKAHDSKVSGQRAAKKRTTKVQHARTQAASLKKVPS